jgi:Protein of unknown function (DUF742)
MTESGRFARQYVHTSGRTQADGVAYALEALVRITPDGEQAISLQQPMRRRILELAKSSISIAEVGAHLGVHVGVVRVLVADLSAERLLRIGTPESSGTDGPDVDTLQVLLRQLEAL